MKTLGFLSSELRLGLRQTSSVLQRPPFPFTLSLTSVHVSSHLQPVLEVDGVVIPQSKAIERFLAKRFGLLGANDVEQALVEGCRHRMRSNVAAVIEQLTDIKNKYMEARRAVGDEQKAKTSAFFSEELPKQLGLVRHAGKKLIFCRLRLSRRRMAAVSWLDTRQRTRTSRRTTSCRLFSTTRLQFKRLLKARPFCKESSTRSHLMVALPSGLQLAPRL
jgi:hypothetical protein